MSDEIDDINQRCTAALRALEAAKVIESAFVKGQAVVDDSGATGVVVTLAAHWRADDPWANPRDAGAVGAGLAVFRPGYGVTGLQWWMHDLSDPVTAASLIVLVREAWGDPIAYVEPTDPIEKAAMEKGGSPIPPWCVMVWSGSAWGPVGWGESGAEACVAALEAKAQEVAP